jgi:hypothetical protein
MIGKWWKVTWGLWLLTCLVATALSLPAFADGGSGGGGGGGNGPTFTAKFQGAAINGVVPQCEVFIDESQALVGGDTIMTVTVKNVNLPDGTVLEFNLDLDPLGSLVLKGGAGTATVNLGRFAPGGRDTFGLDDGTTVLLGGFL